MTSELRIAVGMKIRRMLQKTGPGFNASIDVTTLSSRRSTAARLGMVVAIGLVVSACGSSQSTKTADINTETKFSSQDYGVSASKRVTTAKDVKKGGGTFKIGKPYKVRGKWYYPKEEQGYDKNGHASWYGPNFHGRKTANGEIFDQYHLSGAHPTFPLPSYARVTNLENGHSVVIRVNDRGPFAKGRIIDVSSKAADLLEMKHAGTAKVRVQYMGRARMDGEDMKYLTASYRRNGKPHRLEEPVDGTIASGVMLALAKPRQAITSVFRNDDVQTAAIEREQPQPSHRAIKGGRLVAEVRTQLPAIGPIPSERPSRIATTRTQPAALASYVSQRGDQGTRAPFNQVAAGSSEMTEAMIVDAWRRRLR